MQYPGRRIEMKSNRKTHHLRVLPDSVPSAPIATLLALLLIASGALYGEKVLAQSKRTPTGNRGAQVKPPSAVVPNKRDPYAEPEMLAQLANDKLQELTEKEAPELMEALHKAQRISYQINNKTGCPVTINSAGVKGLRIDYRESYSRIDWSREPGGPVDPPGESYLVTEEAISLKNITDREITAISVVIKDQSGYATGYVDRCLPLKAHAVSTCSQGNRLYIYLNPEGVTAEVDGAYFGDGKVWGRAFRSPPPPPPPPPAAPSTRIFKVEKIQGPPELKVVRRSEQELRTYAIRKVEPVYPNTRDSRGSATVQLIVAPTGKVSCAIFLSGPPAFRRAVIEAVKQWEFKHSVGEVTVGVLSFGSN
jgi:hypothetical protein